MPIGSYFSWARGSRSRPTTPAPSDRYSGRVTRTPSWQEAAIGDKQERYGRDVDSYRTRMRSGERPIMSPVRGLDALQECFWIEDNLRLTGRRLDLCSDRLDQMRDSAALIRQDLEDFQSLLASMEKRGKAHADVQLTEAQQEVGTEQGDKVKGTEGRLTEPPRAQSTTDQRQTSEPSPVEQPAVQPADQSLPGLRKLQSPPEEFPAEELPTEEIPAQSIEIEELVEGSASYTTAPMEPPATETLVESPPSPQRALRHLNSSTERLPTVEEEILRPVTTTANLDRTHLTQSVDDGATPDGKEQQQQSPQSLPTNSPQERSLRPTVAQTKSDEKQQQQQQQTPRSLRSKAVQKRFPISVQGPPPTRGPKAMHNLAPRRASLKPVIGMNKVSQMTQFWSKMDGI